MTRPRSIAAPLAFALALAVALPACGKKSTDPGPIAGPATFVGTAAGSSGGTGVSGSLTVTFEAVTAAQPGAFAARAEVAASGTLTLAGGGTVALTGTYDDATQAVTLAGGDYSFSGTRSGAALNGIFNAPGGIVGGFLATRSTDQSPARVYCGNYASSTPGGPGGAFNLVLAGATVRALAVDAHTGEVVVLEGTLGGATITIADPNGGTLPFATGTLDAGSDTCAGTYDDGLGDTGQWSASRC